MLKMLYLMTSFILFIQQEWTWSFHPEAGFKVLTPLTLIHDVKEVPTPLDVIQFHQYHAGSISDSALAMAFVIDYYKIPQQDTAIDDEYLKDFFENTIDQILTSVDGSLIYMDIIHQPESDVCIWKAKYRKGKGVIRGHTVMANDKYYGLQVFGLESDKPDQLMSRFLDSFKLLPNPSP
jgi:hypothetical protein